MRDQYDRMALRGELGEERHDLGARRAVESASMTPTVVPPSALARSAVTGAMTAPFVCAATKKT
ncbi:hypothetical protein Ms3S1_p20080 (plasmid) [Methylosinus sp. 3S-1]